MLIPKIEYVGGVPSVLVTPGMHIITLKDISVVTSTSAIVNTIVSRVWSATTISGTPNLMLSESAGAEKSIGVASTAAYTVRINLSVVDSDGRSAISSALIINDGIGNLNVITLYPDVKVKTGNLVLFTPVDALSIVSGVSLFSTTPLFTTYNIDYTNDGVFDESNTDKGTFNNTYPVTINNNTLIASLSMTDTPNGIPVDRLFSQISFEPTTTEDSDVIVLAGATCETLDVSSESSNMIDKLVGRFDLDNSSMDYLEVSVDINCCNNDSVFKLHPNYTFSLAPDATSYFATVEVVNVGGNNYNVYTVDLDLTGIDLSLIDTIAYTPNRNSDPTVVTVTNTNILPIEFLMESPLGSHFPVIVENKTMTLTTLSGYIYTVPFTVTPDHSTGFVTIVMGTHVYPSYPDTISVVQTVNTTSVQLVPTSLVSGSTTFYDGVYTVTLNDSGISNTSISGCEFMDCETYCLVVKALANGCSPMVKIIYDALINFSSCPTISCLQICELYALLESLLDECDCSVYQTNTIITTSGCGCS